MTFKYYKTVPLITTILILSGLVELCVGNLINPCLANYLPVGNHFRVPTTVSILGLLFFIYNQYLWKIPVFKLLMSVPDISGRYEGKVKYEWEGIKNEKKCFIEVVQTASKIKVQTYFSDGVSENTCSKSLVEDIKQEEDGFFDIYLFYLNSGTKQNGGLDCHEGANKLRFIPRGKTVNNQLIGHYFTNRQVQTRGEIEAIQISKKLNGKF
jgi:hypothetical protein